MINKRLINMSPKSKKHIKRNILFQILTLISNIIIIFEIAQIINNLYNKSFDTIHISSIIIIVMMICKFIFTKKAAKESYMAAKDIKLILRESIYKKLINLGSNYTEKISTAEVVQSAIEGVEQLETYFGAYLPQFFYAMIAPIILFITLSPISFVSAISLFLCVPLIPLSIIFVQKIAKRILAKYWSQYVKLGSSFLENLQGLTTLKIYQADKQKHEDMNVEAEHFRKVTMKVLTMQLNSIALMDWVAYGGSALGITISVIQFNKGAINLWSLIVIILLSADFFLPLRLLGSYFHIAMNGMAASQKIFKLLDLKEFENGKEKIDKIDIKLKNVSYSYDNSNPVLKNIDIEIPKNSFISIAGESGSGKSTIAKIIAGQNLSYNGSITIGETELKNIDRKILNENITIINHNSYIFKGTVRENLLMANKNASEELMWETLKLVNLYEFLKTENGLDTNLIEQGLNFSGGQRQRLAFARALLLDSNVYISDEATSNIDVESEKCILDILHKLSSTKTIILISHRLANIVKSDNIYVLSNGEIKEKGTHKELLENNSLYKKLWDKQMKLEMYRGGNDA
ncbi:MAG: cysteine ABC transporter ATP-binding protein [Clostridiales bacterium]|nr:MAG: cysteine ABC transporter ATP-binding protein [Clostridiales bacterium]